MGYTIKIGDAVTKTVGGQLVMHVRRIELLNAPLFPGDDLTGRTNIRSPSCGAWSEFANATHLTAMFFAPGGLMTKHPGLAPLTLQHHDQIRAALDRYQTLNPRAVPGWCACERCDHVKVNPVMIHNGLLDGDLARLLWLEFWVTYALACTNQPTFENY